MSKRQPIRPQSRRVDVAAAAVIAAAAVAAHVRTVRSASDMTETLRQVYIDAYLAGVQAAVERHSLKPPVWVKEFQAHPDDYAAQGALRKLLSEAGIKIAGIDDSTMARIEAHIADGLTRGMSAETIASRLSPLIGDDRKRALVIARTETARAMAAGILDTFRVNGVEKWEWLTDENPCPACEENAIGGPYILGSGPEFPGHPNCRCSPSAFTEPATSTGEGGGDDTGDSTD